jgi:hypothetical protein
VQLYELVVRRGAAVARDLKLADDDASRDGLNVGRSGEEAGTESDGDE